MYSTPLLTQITNRLSLAKILKSAELNQTQLISLATEIFPTPKVMLNAKNNESNIEKKKSKKKHNHIPIISGMPFFSTTRRASSSTLLFDLCKNNITTLIIISINHPQKFKTIQPTHLATPISNPITFLLQERTQCFAQ